MTRPAIHTVPIVIASLAAGANASVGTVDQVFDAGAAGGGPSVNDGQSAIQTFTVGIGGTLSLIELQVRQASPPDTPGAGLTIQILGTDGAGVPDLGTVLGTADIPLADVPMASSSNPDFVDVDVLGLGIAVSPGDVLGIHVLYPTGAGGHSWIADLAGDPYGGGELFTSRPGPGVQVLGGDAGFRTSVLIPSPGGVGVLTAAGLAAMRRRRCPCGSACS